MKKIAIKFLAILTLSMSLGSCSDFLDVRPQSSFPDYLMFSNADGFVHALNGAYLVMRATHYHPYSHYYGGYNNDLAFFETLGCGWIVSSNISGATDANLYTHNYDYYLVESAILSYYIGQYRTVTNLNLILKWIDDKEQNFLSDELYSMIKGEALALKSYLMFELIQTFGPPPSSTALYNEKYIPYPSEITTNPYEKETYADYMELLWADIVEAEKLLEQYDPIIHYSVAELAVRGDWSKRRHNKMNYYALMGLKARVQLYNGDKPGALASALTVINAKNEDGSEKFPFKAADSYTSATDLIGVSEHMFAFEHDLLASSWTLNPNNVYSKLTPYAVSSRKIGTGWADPTVDKYDITSDGMYLMERFPGAAFYDRHGIRTQDIRLEKWFFRSTTSLICQKYYPLSQTGHTSALPIMRKAEMLLIAAECEPNLNQAAIYINTLRKARWLPELRLVGPIYEKWKEGELDHNGNPTIAGEEKYNASNQRIQITSTVDLNAPYTNVTFADEYDRLKWVIGEYSREFIMEGRTFFAWKRLGLGLDRLNPALRDLDAIPYPYANSNPNHALWVDGKVKMTEAAYTVPVPKTEVNIEDL